MNEKLEKLLAAIAPLREQLDHHEIYEKVKTMNDLHVFMSHHVYAVWDFMSLVKFLQHVFAPSSYPWLPPKYPEVAHFINDIVLEEESDHIPSGQVMSHFQMYTYAMSEVGIDTSFIHNFIELVRTKGYEEALNQIDVYKFIHEQMKSTLSFIQNDRPHLAASAFCFGRENIIPSMFRALINKMDISKDQAPLFHYYLSRHVELDGETHGPMAIKMVQLLCGEDEKKWEEATQAAKSAIESRIHFWNEISHLI